MPESAVYVGRPAWWGNPFDWMQFGRARAVALFANALAGYWTPTLFAPFEPDELVGEAHRLHTWMQRAARRTDTATADLRGRDLACWCPLDQPCHADVLLELANR
jgi:hypothetical protein